MPQPARQTAEVSRALNALRKMVRGLRQSAEMVERDLGVSAAQLFVMRELAREPNQSVKELAVMTMTTHSTVSEVVGQLITKGLVSRAEDQADRRRSSIRLTTRGSQLLRKAPRAIQEELVDGFSLLRAGERKSLATGLEKWLAASGMSAVKPGMFFASPLLAKGDRPTARAHSSSRQRSAGNNRPRRSK
jgi:MarR family transcriptional regulator, organic hydroperoxide resistance regulator